VEGASRRTALRRTVIATRARAMRKAMTDPEVILWTRLRGRDDDRPIFRRQHPFGSIILDFYCSTLRLAIEIDGATHWDEAAQLKDAARDRWLAGHGVHTLRIPASRIYHDLDGVMDEILRNTEALQRARQPQ
jgi:very-short-patch-repair endonuclease